MKRHFTLEIFKSIHSPYTHTEKLIKCLNVYGYIYQINDQRNLVTFLKLFNAVFRIRIRLDPFHFGLPGSDSFHETDPGSKKNQSNSWEFT